MVRIRFPPAASHVRTRLAARAPIRSSYKKAGRRLVEEMQFLAQPEHTLLRAELAVELVVFPVAGRAEHKRGAPIGFQLTGKHLSEDLLLRAGHAFQSITDWHTRHPTLD